jgi:hypothetical protein
LFTVHPNDIFQRQNQSNEARVMGSLNPYWLSIELDSIDATTEKWSAALWASYQATLLDLTKSEFGRSKALEDLERLGFEDFAAPAY